MMRTRNSSARTYRGIEVALSLCTGSIHASDLWKKIDLYIDALAVAPQLLNIPGDIRIVIRPIKGTVHGRYFGTEKLMEIDPRYEMDRTLATLMHELVHAEQYHEGRLAWNNGKQYWNGTAWKKATTHLAYRRLPWEVEAFGRQDELAEKVLALLGRRSTKTEVIFTPVKKDDTTLQVQPKAPTIDPDSELRVELREALLAEGKYSPIVIDNLVAGDLLNQARRLRLI